MIGHKEKLKSGFHTLSELIVFSLKNKIWWLIPFFFALLIVALLVLVVQKAGSYPFIYVLF